MRGDDLNWWLIQFIVYMQDKPIIVDVALWHSTTLPALLNAFLEAFLLRVVHTQVKQV